MAYFGMTYMGNEEFQKENLAKTHSFNFHEFDDQAYEAAFLQYKLGDTQLALDLEVDGDYAVLRQHVGDILESLIGRVPTPEEYRAWRTHIDFDGMAVLSFEEYMKAVQKLKEFSADPTDPKVYQSFDVFNEHRTRHRRVEYNPQSTRTGPITESQKIGWNCEKPRTRPQSFPSTGTDVTYNEGRSMVDYYGVYTMC